MSQKIVVEKITDVQNKTWLTVFEPGSKIDVKKETKVHWIIAPMGFELKVTKSTGYIVGFPKNKGVKFQNAY